MELQINFTEFDILPKYNHFLILINILIKVNKKM